MGVSHAIDMPYTNRRRRHVDGAVSWAFLGGVGNYQLRVWRYYTNYDSSEGRSTSEIPAPHGDDGHFWRIRLALQ